MKKPRCQVDPHCQHPAVEDLLVDGQPVPHCAMHREVVRILDGPIRALQAMQTAFKETLGRAPK